MEAFKIAGVSVTEQEFQLARSVPSEFDALRSIFNHRFNAWLRFNGLRVDGILKIKMKQAFMAGCFSSLDIETRKRLEQNSPYA